MTTEACSLPTQEEFLANLYHKVSWESITCGICFQETIPYQMALPRSSCHDEKPERTIVAHDNHKFGELCINEWLQSNNTCPLCRKQLFRMPKSESTFDEAEYILPDIDPPERIMIVREGQRNHIVPVLTTEEGDFDPNPETATIQSEILAHRRFHDRLHAYFDEIDRLELIDHAMVQRIKEVGMWQAGAWRLLGPYLSLTKIAIGLSWLCFRMSMSRIVRRSDWTYVRRPSLFWRISDFLFPYLGRRAQPARVLAQPFGLFTGYLRQ